ncbi:hypothetical protein AgCh_012105 [Apium graveolens]
MLLHLLSQDEDYVDCIEIGPHVPMRAAKGNEPSVPKTRHEWSDPNIEQVMKDKKAMNILFNGVDGDMFDNIINCKIAKEVWDTIQIICDGTEQVIAVNGKFSGPTFNVTTNEIVIMNVRNKLNENALVTWPGVQMRRISWQDGVLGTNCPIRPGWNWTYEFQVKDQIGSFFYFPSLNFQRASGGFGSFIITNRKVIPLPFNMPDGDIVILIGDWYTKSHSALRSSLDSGKDLGMPDGVLINGKGPYQYNASVPKGIDYETINVDQESEVLDNWALGHFTSTDCIGDLYIHTGALPDPPNDAFDTSYAVNQAMSIRLWLLEYCATDEALSGMHPGQEWKPMTVSLRNSQDYKEFTLERLYGILKTYELEIDKDERIEKGRKKGGSIELVAQLEKKKEMKVEAVESTSKVCENKGRGLVAENEDHLSQDDMDDIDEHLVFLSRRFSRIKFKKNFGAAKPSRNMVDKYKFKCFKCGLVGHFSSECRKLDSSKKKFEPVDYKHKYFELLKKKEMAFITQENDWAADGLDEDEDVSYVNLALMANLMKRKQVLQVISERNNVLDTQFIEFEKLRIKCKIAKDELTESLKKEEILKKHLEREQEVIKAWKSSRDVHAQITKVQGIESFCDAVWKKSKEKLESNLVEGLLTDVDSTDDENHLSDNQKNYPSSDKEPHPSAVIKPVSKAKLAKLNEKYGSVSKNFVSSEEGEES